MNIIITMAGEGSRFRNAGFVQPKYEIVVKDRTMFEWALSSLSHFYKMAHFVFITRTGSASFIQDKLKTLQISGEVIEIDYLTSGQAATANIAMKRLNPDEAVAVYNIDTFVSPEQLRPGDILTDYTGWIPVFDASGDHWSFVDMDEYGEISRVVEKQRISNWGTVGFYYFSSAAKFSWCYEETYERNKSLYKETFVAPMYQELIKISGNVYGKVIDKEWIVPLGTPEELMASNLLLERLNYE